MTLQHSTGLITLISRHSYIVSMKDGGTPELKRVYEIDDRLKELNDLISREGGIVSLQVKIEGELDKKLTEHQKIAEILDLVRIPAKKDQSPRMVLRFLGRGVKKKAKKKKKDPEIKELEEELKVCEDVITHLSEERDRCFMLLEEIKNAKEERRKLIDEKFRILDAIVADWEETMPIREEVKKSEHVLMQKLDAVTSLQNVLMMLSKSRRHYTLAHSKIKKIKLLFDHPGVRIRPEGKEPDTVMREIKKELLHGELYINRCVDTIREIKHEDITLVTRWLNFVLAIPLPHLVDIGRVDILLSECQEAIAAIDSAEMFLQRELMNERTELENIESHNLTLKESLIAKKQVRIEYYLP